MSRLFSPGVRIVLGFVLLLVYLVPMFRASDGVFTRRLQRDGHTMSLLLPDPVAMADRHAAEHVDEEADLALVHGGEPVPAVIVVHGFAASRQMMLGYGYTLAQAGYAALLVDLPGLGQSTRPYRPDDNVGAIDAAYDALLAQPDIDASRIGLLGHSLGGGAALEASTLWAERYPATVAVSAVSRPVSAATPRNLQLQAGTLEPGYLAQAEQMLAQAGGENDDFDVGRARALEVIPRADHIGIAFNANSHAAAVAWFDEAFEYRVAGRAELRDWRVLGWVLHVVGWMLIASSVAPALPREAGREKDLIRRPMNWVGVAAGPIAATLAVLALRSWIDFRNLGGLVIGGALAFWFLVAGVVFLLLAFRVPRPNGRDLARALGLFVFLVFALGISGHLSWMNFSLTAPRMVRWPLFALACTPWFLAVELAQGDPRGGSRWTWWAIQSATVLGALMALQRFHPELHFVFLPLLPAYFALFVYLGGRVNRPWVMGLSAGAFVGWLLAAAFPVLV